MDKIAGRYTYIVPWYDREDFEQLKHMTTDKRFPATYDDWQVEMAVATKVALMRGVALQMVNVRIADYFAWLTAECRADTVDARAAYFQKLALEASSRLVGGARSTKECTFPTKH